MSRLDRILGQQIKNVRQPYDYVQLEIGDSTLTIYNPVKILDADGDIDSMKALEGHFVRAVEEIETSITLVLDTDARLVIDLHRDVFRTPEAIVLEREGDEAVVWP